MHTASINGIQVAYRDTGSGTPLLLVHAFPLSGAMWQPQIAALAATHRVIAPDLRGFGASELGDPPQSLDQYADDLVALLDHLELEQVALGGLSMGGYIAFALLRRHPQRIRALLLADTRATPDSPEALVTRETSARLAEEQGAGAIAEQMLPKLLAQEASEAIRSQVRQIIEANDRRAIAAALRAMARRPDSSALLGQISVPTLVVVGSEDGLTPPSEVRAMQAAIPHSRMIEIPGTAHLTNLEAPDPFNSAVRQFV